MKGSILGLYTNECLFYLERRIEVGDGFIGPFLKYGQKRKPVNTTVDLSYSGPTVKERVHIIKVNGSKTKFRIITPETILKLKASSDHDREEWILALTKEI